MTIPKLPKLNWKLLITVLAIIVFVIAIARFIPKILSDGTDKVQFTILAEEEIPDKIQEILPRYKVLERALAVKIEETVYIIVTRGEKLTGGYGVDIEKLELIEEDETKLIVYAVFKDPGKDELVPQVITYPYVVATTNLKELPNKIELKVAK